MKAIALAFAIIVSMVTCALAQVTSGDSFDLLGTPSFTSLVGGYQVPPYQVLPIGDTISIQSISNPPWNLSGYGHYLDIPTGTTSVPNAGPGVYMTPGNPQQGWLLGFWFNPVALTAATDDYFLRFNKAGGQTFGGDTIALIVTSTGKAKQGASLGTTSLGFTANTWVWVEYCIQYGTGHTDGSESLYVGGVNWSTSTGLSLAVGSFGAANFNFDNEFGNGHYAFGPWYEKNIGTTACPAGGTHSIMYFKEYQPAANSAVTWTPSTGSNFSNVNSNPAGANSNSSATVGNKDIFTTGVPSGQTGIIGAVASVNAEKTDGGDRIMLPTWSVSGVATAGSVGNAVPANGAYTTILDGAAPSLSATDLGFGGNGLNN